VDSEEAGRTDVGCTPKIPVNRAMENRDAQKAANLLTTERLSASQ
jgi:hypothetical protein